MWLAWGSFPVLLIHIQPGGSQANSSIISGNDAHTTRCYFQQACWPLPFVGSCVRSSVCPILNQAAAKRDKRALHCCGTEAERSICTLCLCEHHFLFMFLCGIGLILLGNFAHQNRKLLEMKWTCTSYNLGVDRAVQNSSPDTVSTMHDHHFRAYMGTELSKRLNQKDWVSL